MKKNALIYLLVGLSSAACRDSRTGGTTHNPDGGTATHDASTQGADAGIAADDTGVQQMPPDGGTEVTSTNVQGAIAGVGTVHTVEIADAVVVAENHYAAMAGGTIGTFYIQDRGASGAAISVYHSSRDTAPFPMV